MAPCASCISGYQIHFKFCFSLQVSGSLAAKCLNMVFKEVFSVFSLETIRAARVNQISQTDWTTVKWGGERKNTQVILFGFVITNLLQYQAGIPLSFVLSHSLFRISPWLRLPLRVNIIYAVYATCSKFCNNVEQMSVRPAHPCWERNSIRGTRACMQVRICSARRKLSVWWDGRRRWVRRLNFLSLPFFTLK